MRVEGIDKFITRGKNIAVLDTVIDTYNMSKDQPLDILVELQGCDYATQCAAIFGYVIDKVHYVEDPDGVQLVKTPARLIADGTGDCKSMAIFIGACLHCLDIPFVFRFVGFARKNVYNHVYIVAKPGTMEQIVLDPVERVDGEPVFDYARPYYITKIDIKG